MKNLTLFTLVIFSSLLTTHECAAQYGKYWENVGQIGPNEFGATQRVNCGWFWAKDTGIVGTGPNCGYRAFNDCGFAKIYYRRGQKWLPANHPDLRGADARQIVMKDRDTGYAVFERPSVGASGPSALKTTDGGVNWTIFIPSTGGEAVDAIIDQNGNLIYVYGYYQSNPPNFFSFGVPGSSVAYAANKLMSINNDLIQYTYDGGLHWGQEYFSIKPTGSYGDLGGLFYTKKFNTLVVVPIASAGANGPLISTDTGATFTYLKDWNGAFKGRWDGTGDVRGGTDVIYVQASVLFSDQSKGFLRSLDGGYHWQNIGGPTSTNETRFFVLGCTGSTVFAFDTSGGIWYTETGGDGTMKREIYNHPKFSGPRSISAALCDDSLISLPFLNELCADFRIDSIGWITSDASLDSKLLSSGALTLTHPAFPQTYSSETGDTVKVAWSPGLLFDHDTSFTRTIFIRYLSGSDLNMHDTTITITLTAKSMAPRIAMDRDQIDFETTSTCFSRDTTVTFTNTSCDTLTIDDLTGRGPFDLSGIVTPLRLAPGETITLTIGFHPQSQGQQFGNVHLDATHQGIQRGFDIPLSGTGAPGAGLLELLSAKDIKLPDLSICAGDDTLALLRNTGCDTLIVKNVTVTGSGEYALSSPVQNIVLPPDSSFTFRITFTPQDKGQRTALVTIAWTDEKGANTKDIAVKLDANVTDGTKVLGSSLTSIDFGETSICEERDSVLRLTNNGCDTLTITGADVDQHFLLDGNFPITLLPGQTIDLPITTVVDTTGKPRTLTGLLNVHSTSDNVIAPITLSRGLYYPTKLRLEAIEQTSGKVGDVVKFKVILDGEIPARMTALHFDLSHNDDLLGFQSLASQDLTVVATTGNEQQTQSFRLSPVRETGVIGELTFKVFLAIAEQTTFSFSNIRFDASNMNGQPVIVKPECIAVIADSGTHFDYVYTCGDGAIRNVLSNQRHLVNSIKPNPASNLVRLNLAEEVISIKVIDGQGKTVIAMPRVEVLNIGALPSGNYHLQADTPTESEIRSFIITR